MTVPKELIFTDASGNTHDVSKSVLIRDWIKYDKFKYMLTIDKLLDWRNRLSREMLEFENKERYYYEIMATDFLLSIYASELN